MKNRPSLQLLSIVAVLALVAGPSGASGISVLGSYLDLDDPDGALGLGFRSEIAFGESWALTLTTSYFDRAEVTLSPDLVDVEITDEVRFLPADLELRYLFGEDDRTSLYIGGGYSYMTVDSEVGRSDEVHGLLATVGVLIGDDAGPKLFVEGSLRGYEDVDLELFEGLDSDDVTEVGADGFSVAFGVHWDIGG